MLILISLFFASFSRIFLANADSINDILTLLKNQNGTPTQKSIPTYSNRPTTQEPYCSNITKICSSDKNYPNFVSQKYKGSNTNPATLPFVPSQLNDLAYPQTQSNSPIGQTVSNNPFLGNNKEFLAPPPSPMPKGITPETTFGDTDLRHISGKFTGDGIGGKNGTECEGGIGSASMYDFHPITCKLDRTVVPPVVKTQNVTANGLKLGLPGEIGKDSIAMPLRCGARRNLGKVFRIEVNGRCVMARQDDVGGIPRDKIDLTGNIARYLMTGNKSKCIIGSIARGVNEFLGGHPGRIANVKYFLVKSGAPNIKPGEFVTCDPS